MNVYNASIDIMILQLKNRFAGVAMVTNRFQCLSPLYLTLDSSTNDDLYEAAAALSNMYSEDLSDQFPNQLLSFRVLFKEEMKKLSSVKDLANMLIIENHPLLSSFSDVYTAFMLFMTLPVTVATAERSFSKLKLIKTYLRNTMVQDRLSGLTLLSIENTQARAVDVTKIIDDFARLKARKGAF